MFQTFIIYNSILFFSTAFAWLANKVKGTFFSFFFICISFLAICLPTVIRYDVGHDYSGYMEMFKGILEKPTSSYSIEPTFLFMSRLFSFSPNGYIGVIATYFFFSLFFFFKLSKKKELPYLIFFFTTFSVGYFTFDDQIRQSLAIIIFAFSVKFIERKKLKNFVFVIIIATLFHYSALLLLPIYYLARVNISTKISLGVVLLLFFINIFNLSGFLIKELFELVPYYERYAEIPKYIETREVNTGLGVLLQTVIYSILIFYKKSIDRPILINLVFFGLIIHLLSSGNLNMVRMSKYFLFLSIFGFARLFVQERGLRFFSIKLFVLVASFILFQKTLVEKVKYPQLYKTIFSHDAEIEYIEPKKQEIQ